MSEVVGERFFVSNSGRVVLSVFPHGTTGHIGDWTEGEHALFEQLCQEVLNRLPDDAKPMDIALALEWMEITKEQADEIILQKSLDANIEEGRMIKIKGKSDSDDKYQLTEAGRIYVEQYLPARKA